MNDRNTPDPSRSSGSGAEQQYFVISVAALVAGMNAQTLRTNDRLGLVTPLRTSGGGRRYSSHDVTLRILEMAEEIERVHQSYRRDLLPVPRNNALVVWQPRRGAAR